MATQKKEVVSGVPHPLLLYKVTGFAMDWTFLTMALFYIVVVPFSKVEESFNLHAAHDVIMYGVGSNTLHNYDHFTFPGAVPRTFVGSVLLGWLVRPAFGLVGWLCDAEVHPKMQTQISVRVVLLLLNAYGLRRMRIAVERRFDTSTSSFFQLLTIIQFHIPFWMGRTLPNMFAFLPVTVALSMLIEQSPHLRNPSKLNVNIAIALLTFTTVVFRAEILLLLIPIALQALWLRYITFSNLAVVGLVSGLASLCLTVTVDSYFWDRPFLWPEFSSIYFNVYEGKSSEWGTSPPLAYFTTHLPKLLGFGFPLSILGFAIDRQIRILLLPCLVFVGLMSFLAHKEWRFIVYVIPMFSIAAARGGAWMSPGRHHTRSRGIILLFMFYGLVLSNIFLKVVLGVISSQNYPGGQALVLFHKTYAHNYTTPLSTPPHIHICNLAAQTGASLFLQYNAPPYHPTFIKPVIRSASKFQIPPVPWIYNKTENMSVRDLTLSKQITHLISEVNPESEEGVEMERDWELVIPVRTRSRLVFSWRMLKGEWPYELEDKLWIYERIWSQDEA